MYKTVTLIMMVSLENSLLNASLCHDISVPIRTIQYWGTVREPKIASYKQAFILTDNVLSDKN